jgi:uncharacterized protein YbjT (DUF2867 family)
VWHKTRDKWYLSQWLLRPTSAKLETVADHQEQTMELIVTQQRNKVILVTGATGNQGGAVARRLMGDGWTVRALTRAPSSPAARKLATAGAQIAAGTPADRSTLDAAMTGVYGVFSVQPGVLGTVPVAYDDEIAWGCGVADAASAADVTQLVFSSVAGAARAAEVAAFGTKLRIEQHIHRIGIPATILRPASFMENYADPAFGIGSGALATPLAGEIPEQLIALDDIGTFASLAFADPNTYLGRTVEIAGDELTPAQTARAVSKAINREIPYVPVPIEAVRTQNKQFADAADFLNHNGGYRADLAAARELHPGLLTFDDWLTAGGAAAITGLFA